MRQQRHRSLDLASKQFLLNLLLYGRQKLVLQLIVFGRDCQFEILQLLELIALFR